MNRQESYPASQIEPGWHILIDGQWLVAGMVIESETPSGTQYITIVCEDSKQPAVKLLKTQEISARPPNQAPEASPGT